MGQMPGGKLSTKGAKGQRQRKGRRIITIQSEKNLYEGAIEAVKIQGGELRERNLNDCLRGGLGYSKQTM